MQANAQMQYSTTLPPQATECSCSIIATAAAGTTSTILCPWKPPPIAPPSPAIGLPLLVAIVAMWVGVCLFLRHFGHDDATWPEDDPYSRLGW